MGLFGLDRAGSGEVLLRPSSTSKGLIRKAEKDFTRALGDRTRSSVFKPKEGRFRLDVMAAFLTVRVVRLARVAQRSCGCLVPGSVQGQVVWGFEHHFIQ